MPFSIIVKNKKLSYHTKNLQNEQVAEKKAIFEVIKKGWDVRSTLVHETVPSGVRPIWGAPTLQ